MDNSERKPKLQPIGEALMRMARSRKIGIPRFRFPIPTEEAYQLIGAFYNAEVERRGYKCEFGEFTLDKIWKVAEILTSPHPRFGLIFTGQVGNGKTTLLHAVNSAARYLADRGLIDPTDYGYQYKSDFGMDFYNAKQLAQIAKSDWKRFELIMAKPMLAVDELGEEPKTVLEYGNALNPIIDLIEHRYNHQKFTVITSNLDPKEISEKYGARIADRFREMLSVVVFGDEKSFRK